MMDGCAAGGGFLGLGPACWGRWHVFSLISLVREYGIVEGSYNAVDGFPVDLRSGIGIGHMDYIGV